MATKTNPSYAEFVQARKKYIGGSDIASVKNVGRYGCARKLGYDKLDYPKDIPDEEKMEFRRGRRLEGIAANYYSELTGRETWVTSTIFVPGKPHLAINIDRFIAKVEDKEKKSWGYLEIKVMGRFAFLKAKKAGLIDDYILQVQYGMAVAAVDWGAFAIYCPDTDEMIHWDFEADKDLGEHLLEAADDFWNFNIECKIIPEPLPEGSEPCSSCPWQITCRGSIQAPANAGVVVRNDLEPLAYRLAEVRGMGSEVEQAEEALKEEFIEAVKGVPGIYVCGKWEVPFTVTKQKRFSSELLKKKDPALYESLRVESEVKTLRKPKEL